MVTSHSLLASVKVSRLHAGMPLIAGALSTTYLRSIRNGTFSRLNRNSLQEVSLSVPQPDNPHLSPPGMMHTELKTGMLVTISSNKLTGDRSLVDAIWEITGLNDGHALLTRRMLGERHDDTVKVQLVPLREHEFYAADALAAAAASGAVPSLN